MRGKASQMPRILVAEDDRHSLSGLMELLYEEGYEVTGVNRGRQALQTLEHEQFDVMLTDMKMPDLDGRQLIAQSRPLAPEMKTIVMSATHPAEAISDLFEHDIFKYLTKPLDLDELFFSIRKAIGMRELSHVDKH